MTDLDPLDQLFCDGMEALENAVAMLRDAGVTDAKIRRELDSRLAQNGGSDDSVR